MISLFSKTIIKIDEILIPVIVLFIIIMGAITIKQINNITINTEIMPIISGILYANYNSIVLLPMLITLTEQIQNKKHLTFQNLNLWTTIWQNSVMLYKNKKV